MGTNLIRIDKNLNGAVSPTLVKCVNETLGQLNQLWHTWVHTNEIKKKTVHAIFARAHETFYSSLVMLQIQAGATLGLQARSHLECIADVIGFAEDTQYLEKWIGTEKAQWKNIAKASMQLQQSGASGDSPDDWSAFCTSRLIDIQNFCLRSGLCYEHLPQMADRYATLQNHAPRLAVTYKFLCVDAHCRPTSVLNQNAPSGFVEIFVPTKTIWLEYYLRVMLQAWAMGVKGISKIWDGDEAMTRVAKLLIDVIQASLEEHSEAFDLENAIETL